MITIEDQSVAGFIVSVVPEAFDTRKYDEDGQPLIGESFAVWVTGGRGRRFQFIHTYSTTISTDDDGYPHVVGFEKARNAARREADRVVAILKIGARLVQAEWPEIDPMYGSEAYEAQGIEARRAHEEREEAYA